MKQISQVLEAVEDGAETSDAVAAITGLSVAAASSYLNSLSGDGVIRLTQREGRRFSRCGRCSHIYAPVSQSTS